MLNRELKLTTMYDEVCVFSCLRGKFTKYGGSYFIFVFTEYASATCGNKVVESGEDCDCGWDDDCTDPCCYPTLSATGPDSAKACQYRPAATCR